MGFDSDQLTNVISYWDWNLDVPPYGICQDSPIWNDMHGVGGNSPFVDPDPDPNPVPGRTGGGCIQSGPFKDLIVNLGPLNSLAYNPRCLTRDFSPYFAERYSGANNTQFCMSHEDYGSFFRGVMAKRDYEAYGLHVYMVVDIVQSGV